MNQKVTSWVILFSITLSYLFFTLGRAVNQLILFNQLKIEGFIVWRWIKEWPECFKQMSQWIAEVRISNLLFIMLLLVFYVQGKLKYEETVTVGFDNMFEAFLGLFTGANTGKAVVKAWTWTILNDCRFRIIFLKLKFMSRISCKGIVCNPFLWA